MSQFKAWDCPICGKKGLHVKGIYPLGMNGALICLPCYHKLEKQRTAVTKLKTEER